MIKFNTDRRKLSVPAVISTLMMAILASGCSNAEDNTQPISQGFEDAFVGMCFNDANPEDTQIDESLNAAITHLALESVSCQAPHDNEVYYIHDLPEEPEVKLDTDAFFEKMLDVCEDEFEDYIGKSYKDSFYEMSVLFPPRESWKLGHKQAICYAFHPEEEKLSFELKGIDE